MVKTTDFLFIVPKGLDPEQDPFFQFTDPHQNVTILAHWVKRIKDGSPTLCSPRKTSLNFRRGFPKSPDVAMAVGHTNLILKENNANFNQYIYNLVLKMGLHFV